MTRRLALVLCAFLLACTPRVDPNPDDDDSATGDDDDVTSEPSMPFVSAGTTHSCALMPDGEIVCWGAQAPPDDPGWESHGQADPPDGAFVALSSGQLHTCGIREGGEAECWGHNQTPEAVPAEAFVSIAGGESKSCGVTTDGTLSCWPEGVTDVPTEAGWVSVDGDIGFCALDDSGGVHCFGQEVDDSLSQPVSDLAMGRHHVCGLGADAEVECVGSPSGPDNLGQTEPPEERFTQIDGSENHNCGVLEGGDLRCWGSNQFGQSAAPEGEFVQVSSGVFHSCGVRADGGIECWGCGIDWGACDVPALD